MRHYPNGLDVITRVLIGRGARVRVRRGGNVKAEAEIGVMLFQDGERRPQVTDSGGHWKLQGTRKQTLPRASRKNHPP